MNYLFFDIECCDGQHICEFGYVLADEMLNVVEKNHFLMNPEAKFNLIGRPDREDLHLYYDYEVYYRSPIFKEFYDIIKWFLESKDNIVVGFSTKDDVLFLNTACKRYSLKNIEFTFFDIQKIFVTFFNNGKIRSLENATKDLQIDTTKLFVHRSDEDAYMTLLLLQKMSEDKKVPVKKLLEMLPTVKGEAASVRRLNYRDRMEALWTRPNTLSNSQKEKLFKEFKEKVKPRGEAVTNELTDKTICFSYFYEHENLKQCIVLGQIIVNCGGQITSKVSECNYYIKHEKDEETKDDDHTRYHHLIEVMQDADINIISYEELLSILHVTSEDLESAPIPTTFTTKTKVLPEENTRAQLFVIVFARSAFRPKLLTI